MRILCLLSALISEILGTVVERDTVSCHPWKLIEIDVLFYGHHWGEPGLTQISILNRYNNFKCALRQRWKLRPIHTKIWQSHSCKTWIWKTALFNTEDQSIHFYKTFENSPSPDKTYTFSFVFRNCFQVFWKGFNSPVHDTGNWD